MVRERERQRERDRGVVRDERATESETERDRDATPLEGEARAGAVGCCGRETASGVERGGSALRTTAGEPAPSKRLGCC